MITKGIIEEVIGNNKVKVRCPTIDKIPESDLCNLNLNEAIVCTLPGSSVSPRKGDVVFVGFENENFSLPIVLGYLYIDEPISSYNSLNTSSLTSRINTVLPKNTSIGSLNWNNIYSLKNLSNNIKETFDTIDSKINDNSYSIEELSNSLNSIEKKLLNLEKLIKKDSSNIMSIRKILGEFGDTSNRTLFGRLHSIIEKLNNIEKYLGVFSKENTLSDQFNKIDNLINSISNYSSNVTSTFNDEPDCMLTRAEKMITVTWVPKYTFNKWNSSDKFIAGQTYMGMPYTMFAGGYTYDAWKKNAENNTSSSGSIAGYGDRVGPKYGSCCADFVSEVLGLPKHQRTCKGIENQVKYLDKLTGDSAKAYNIKPGDVLMATGEYHVMWVGDVNNDTLTIYEQNPPLAHKFNLSISKNVKNGFIYWGGEYGIILRPTKELMSLDCNIKIDNSLNITSRWVYKGNKIFEDSYKQSLTNDEYLNNALLFWKACKKAGWTAESAAGAWSTAYNTSFGNPWSYNKYSYGLFNFNPFNNSSKNGRGIYDYSLKYFKDPNKRWDGDVQVDYINWQLENVIKNNWKDVFYIRYPTTKYWSYTPSYDNYIPRDNFNLNVYVKLDKKSYGATPTICAKLWLARYVSVNRNLLGKDLDRFIENSVKKAEELYQLFIKY